MRAWTLILPAAGAMLFAAGCTPAPPANPIPSAPSEPPVAPPRPAVRTFAVTRSVQGRPIVVHVFGDAPRPVLIFGGIHGDEPTSRELAERFVQYLRDHPDLWHGRSVIVAPAINPDGLAAGTRQNAHGVDCNRNFPAKNWRRTAPSNRYHGGPAPASEPETCAVLALVKTYKAARVVSVHAISGGRECNNYDGPAQRIAEVMSARNGYPPKASIGYPTPGSFGTWAGVERKIPVITLELPAGKPIDAVWPGNRDALLSLLGAAPAARR